MIPRRTNVQKEPVNKESDRLLLETQYDTLAPLYEKLMGDEGDLPNKYLLNPLLIERLPDNRALDVLEAGCGTGRWSAILAEKYQHVVALDKAHGMMKIALEKRSSPNISYVAADLEGPLPFKDNSFGFIFSNMVMHYVADIDKVAREFYRVMKHGSRLVFSTMHPQYDAAKDPSLRDKQTRTQYLTETLNGTATLTMFYERLDLFIFHFTNAGLTLIEEKDAIITPEFVNIYPRYKNYVGLARFAIFVFEKE